MINFKNLGQVAIDRAPHILTYLAAAGVVTTTVLAVKATPGAMHAIDYRRDELWQESGFTDPGDYEISRRDTVKAAWKFYMPAAIFGTATIACIIGANTVSSRRQAALVAGYSVVQKSYQEYQEKVREEIGPKKDEEIRAEINQRRVNENNGHEVLIEESGKSMCFDTFSNRYFYSTKEEIQKAVNDVNLMVINSMYASMNDFYKGVGLGQISMGEEYGWTNDVSMDIYFTAILTTDDRPVLAIDYYNAPIRDYHKIW